MLGFAFFADNKLTGVFFADTCLVERPGPVHRNPFENSRVSGWFFLLIIVSPSAFVAFFAQDTRGFTVVLGAELLEC
jgi:hypothetical protein